MMMSHRLHARTMGLKQRTKTKWKPLCARQVAASTKTTINEIFQLLPAGPCIHCDQSEVMAKTLSLLKTCPPGEPICDVLDKQGFNVFQRAVIANHVAFLETFLQRKYPYMLNVSVNAPLLIALAVGAYEIMALLLKLGADPECDSCIPHQVLNLCPVHTIGEIPAKLHIKRHYYGSAVKETLESDDVVALSLLLDSDTGKRTTIDLGTITHRACKVKAQRCLSYLLQRLPKYLNTAHPQTGDTPLAVALLHSEECAKKLLTEVLDLGGMLDPKSLMECNLQKISALHVLLGSKICCELFSLTRMIIAHAPDQGLLYARDRLGNTLLHTLAMQVGRRIQAKGKQQIFDRELLRCLYYFLNSGLDINALNNRGETALHLLFQNTVARPLLVTSSHSTGHILLQVITAMDILLSHGADVRCEGVGTSGIVHWVVSILCSMCPGQVKEAGCHAVQAIKTLIKSGAEASSPDKKGIYILTMMLTVTNRWLFGCPADDPPLGKQVMSVSRDVIEMVCRDQCFDQELADTLSFAVKQVAIISNVSLDMGDEFGLEVGKLLEPVILAGLHPNKPPYRACWNRDPSTVTGNHMAANQEVMFHLARALIINSNKESGIGLLSLFWNTLTQENFNDFINTLCGTISTEFHRGSDVLETVGALNKTPRKLCTLARICINENWSWKHIPKRKRFVPLPRALQDYLQGPLVG